VPVHDIDMEQVSASGFDLRHLFAEAGKIGCEDGWCDLYHRFPLVLGISTAEAGDEYSLSAPLFWRQVERASTRCRPERLLWQLMIDRIKPQVWMCSQKRLYNLRRFFWLV